MATEYGKRLRQARQAAGLTQNALSKKTGIPQSTISTAEREGRGSAETPVYARACGVSSIWLAKGEGEPGDGAQEPNGGGRRSTDLDHEVAKLSPDAIEMGLLFDILTDRIERTVARNAATEAILRVINARASRPSGTPVPTVQKQKQRT